MRNLEDKTLLASVVGAVTLICMGPVAILRCNPLGGDFGGPVRAVPRRISTSRWPSLAAPTTLVVILCTGRAARGGLINATAREAGNVYRVSARGNCVWTSTLNGCGKHCPVGLLAWQIGSVFHTAALREKISATVMQSGEFLAGQGLQSGADNNRLFRKPLRHGVIALLLPARRAFELPGPLEGLCRCEKIKGPPFPSASRQLYERL